MARKHGFFRPHVGGMSAIYSTTLQDGAGGGFEPGRDLYLPGDILLDYDPADLTTMFKDVAGTQPVTADGDSIALHLDKGQWGGRTLAAVKAAAAEIAVGGEFNDSADWPTKDAGWTVSGGAAFAAAVAASAVISQPTTVTAGSLVFIEFDCIVTAGSVRIALSGGTQANCATQTVSGTYGQYLFVNSGNNILNVQAGSGGFTGSVTRLTVKEIPGYHRAQATGTSQRKYKTDGTLHWSLYDGTDDGDATQTINWGTDEAATAIGVRFLSSGVFGLIAEFSASVGSNAGFTWYRSSNVGQIGHGARGSSEAGYVGGSFGSDTDVVLCGNADIAGAALASEVFPRLNAVPLSSGGYGTALGTGNFGNFPLYFGRRAGTSFPFNGREYRTVIRNRLWSASEQSRLEAFIAAKSGVTL